MDLELARTYLAVLHHGSFKHAATTLHCTQSTVTARIHNLETLLGRVLFTRSRAGAAPTAEGRRFRPYAERLLLGWREAQQALSLPNNLKGTLRIAIDQRLSAAIGTPLSAAVHRELPDWSIELLEASHTDVDIRIGYGLTPDPGRHPLATSEDWLVLVTTSERHAVDWDPQYRAIDWGSQFREQYAKHYPFDEVPQLHLPATLWSLEALCEIGGAAYFPLSWCRSRLATGTLFRVNDAAEFPLLAAAVHQAQGADWEQGATKAISEAFATLTTPD